MSAVCSLRYEALGKFGEEARVALGYASSITTVQGATFNMHGQLYCGHINATALFSSQTTRVLVLAGARHCDLETCRKKKCELRF